MFVVEIPFGVQESHEDPARENGLIFFNYGNRRKQSRNVNIWFN